MGPHVSIHSFSIYTRHNYVLYTILSPRLQKIVVKINDSEKESTYVLFTHALRGNLDRHERNCYKDFCLPGLPVYATNGPDHITEEMSDIISPARISALPSLFQKIRGRIYREWVLLKAQFALGYEQAICCHPHELPQQRHSHSQAAKLPSAYYQNSCKTLRLGTVCHGCRNIYCQHFLYNPFVSKAKTC